MNNNFIPQMEPWFSQEEKKAINQYMEEGGWLTEFKRIGKNVEIGQNVYFGYP